ncbi:hypothetical protein BH23ACT5_BH23ACT5_06490 [soil metagenome]
MEPRWVAAVAVAALSVAGGWWWGRGVVPPEPVVAPTVVSVTSESDSGLPAHIAVHVGGWVVSPGVVELVAGSRVADALAAVGGTRRDATLDALNLAQVLVDGQQVIVPGPGDAPAAPDDGSSSDGLIRLNTATAIELQSLPGVGPVLAERIVAHREAAGPYGEVEDLLDVAGIGETRLASIRDLLVVP